MSAQAWGMRRHGYMWGETAWTYETRKESADRRRLAMQRKRIRAREQARFDRLWRIVGAMDDYRDSYQLSLEQSESYLRIMNPAIWTAPLLQPWSNTAHDVLGDLRAAHAAHREEFERGWLSTE